jgi:hypothetical protein
METSSFEVFFFCAFKSPFHPRFSLTCNNAVALVMHIRIIWLYWHIFLKNLFKDVYENLKCNRAYNRCEHVPSASFTQQVCCTLSIFSLHKTCHNINKLLLQLLYLIILLWWSAHCEQFLRAEFLWYRRHAIWLHGEKYSRQWDSRKLPIEKFCCT